MEATQVNPQALQANGAGIPFAMDSLTNDVEFLGVITVDESVTGDYGPQWHYAIKPVDYELGGKTGSYHEYVGTDKTTLRSKFGTILSAFIMVYGAGAFPAIGAGHLVGTVGIFKRIQKDYGVDRQTGERNIREYLVPVKSPNEAELARAGAKQGGNVSKPVANPLTLTDDDKRALIATLTGNDSQGAIIAVARNKDISQELKGAILNGTAIPALISQGALVMNSDGKFAPGPNAPESETSA